MRRLTKLARGACLLIIVFAAWNPMSETVRAETLQEQALEQEDLAERPLINKWNVTLGSGVAARPTYPGSSSYQATPIPLVSITYGNLLFLGPLGVGVNVINWAGLRAGPVIGYGEGRDQSDDPHLNGLGNIQPCATAGMFVSYRIGSLEASATVRQAITHARNGLTGLAQIEYRQPIIPHRLDFSVGPELQFADRHYNGTWFGITPSQSARSGLPIFTPGAGINDIGLHAGLTYHYSKHILLRVLANVNELTGDIAKSPVVQNKTQTVVGVGVAYHF